jgi:hypothetical protein
LNPVYIDNHPKHAKLMMTELVKLLTKKCLLPKEIDPDLVIRLYSQLLEDADYLRGIQEFKLTKEGMQPGLDEFFYKFTGSVHKYEQLWIVIRKVLTLSHGNASVSF